jgi:hypothetical protein
LFCHGRSRGVRFPDELRLQSRQPFGARQAEMQTTYFLEHRMMHDDFLTVSAVPARKTKKHRIL